MSLQSKKKKKIFILNNNILRFKKNNVKKLFIYLFILNLFYILYFLLL